MIYCHVIVERALGGHLLLTNVAVVSKHSRKVNALTMIPHSYSADEPLATNRAHPLILARVRVFVLLDKLKKLFGICETLTRS